MITTRVTKINFASKDCDAGARQREEWDTTPMTAGLRCCLFIILIVGVIQPGVAQSGQGGGTGISRTLDFYLSAAVANAPNLHDLERQRAIAALRAEADAARASGVHAWLSSEYLFSPFFSNNGLLVTANPPSGAVGYDVGITNGGQYSALLHAERSIFTGRLTDALSEQGDVQQDLLRHDYALEKRKLRKDVTDLYLETFRLQMLRSLSEKIVENLQSELVLLNNLQRMGLSPSRDYMLLKIEVESQQVDLRDTGQRLRSGLRRLAALCGLPQDTLLIDLQPAELALEDSGDGAGFLQRFLLDSLTLSAEQAVFESSYAPQVRLFANTGLNAVELHDIQQKFGLSAGFSLTLPLYDGGQKQRKQEETLLALKSISEFRRRSELSIHTARSAGRDKLQTLQRNLQSVDSQLVEYGTILELSRRQLSEGGLSMIEYLTLVRKRIDLSRQQIGLRISILHEINALNYWSWQNDRRR